MASHHPRERARRFPFPPYSGILRPLYCYSERGEWNGVEWRGHPSTCPLASLRAVAQRHAAGDASIASDQMLGRTCRSDACCDLGSPLLQ